MISKADLGPGPHREPEGVPWRKEPCRVRVKTKVRAGQGPMIDPDG
jgi:hypothetical protein